MKKKLFVAKHPSLLRKIENESKKNTSLFLGFDFPLKDAGFILLCDKRKTDTSNKTMTLWENKLDRLSLKPSLMFSCKAEANSSGPPLSLSS